MDLDLLWKMPIGLHSERQWSEGPLQDIGPSGQSVYFVQFKFSNSKNDKYYNCYNSSMWKICIDCDWCYNMELQEFILNDTIMEPFHLVLGINSKT